MAGKVAYVCKHIPKQFPRIACTNNTHTVHKYKPNIVNKNVYID